MNGSTHTSTAREIARAVFPPTMAQYVEDVAKAACLPDDMGDVIFGRFGSKPLGHDAAAVDHFCVPTGSGHFRGYSWHGDTSLCHAIRRFDPRVGNVDVRPQGWFPVVGQALALQHPLSALIKQLGGKATLDADNMTFPTAAVMAEWVWKVVATLNFTPPPPKVVGCILHWIGDSVVPHHAHGWNLAGHQKLEARVERMWSSDEESIVAMALLHAAQEDGAGVPCPLNPRTLVEHVAQETFDLGMAASNPELVLLRAAMYSRIFLRRVVLPLVVG